MIKKLIYTLFILSGLILTLSLLAQDNLTIKSKSKNKPSKVNQPTNETNSQNTKKEESKPIVNLTLGYSISSDYADDRKPRVYDNRLSTKLVLRVLPYNIITTLKNALSFTTLGGSLYEDDPHSNGFHLADTTLIFNKAFPLETPYLFGKHTLIPMIFNIIPTSDSSRYAGYKSTPGAQLILSSDFLNSHYNLVNGINAMKVINTYTNHPATGKPSPDVMTTFSQEHTINIAFGFSIGASFSLKYSKNVNGFSNTSYETEANIGYTYSSFSASLSYAGGDHSTSDKVELWYIDKTRRLLTLDLAYTF